MKELIFQYLNKNYNTKFDKEKDIDVIYSFSSDEFQYYNELVEEFETIFSIDKDLICKYIKEWAIFDISEYTKIKKPYLADGGNYSIAFGVNSYVVGNYSVGV